MATQRDIVNRQIAAQEFWDRMHLLIGSERPYTWAERHGIPKSSFQAARQRGSKPLTSTLNDWALRIGCDPDWLATGNGTPWPTQAQSQTGPAQSQPLGASIPPPQINTDLLILAMTTVDDVLSGLRRRVTREKKARLIAAIYALYADAPDPARVQDNVIELIRSAA